MAIQSTGGRCVFMLLPPPPTPPLPPTPFVIYYSGFEEGCRRTNVQRPVSKFDEKFFVCNVYDECAGVVRADLVG